MLVIMKTNGRVRARNTIKIACVALALISIFAFGFGCSEKKVVGAKYLGSFLSSDVYLYLAEEVPSSRYDELETTCAELIAEYERVFSVAKENGELNAFNRVESGEKFEISKRLDALFTLSRELYEKTDGAFDPTVYPLVDLYGFSYRFDGAYSPVYPFDRSRDGEVLPLPEQKFVSAFASLANLSAIERTEEDGRVFLKKTLFVDVDGVTYQQQADMSSVAKGALADDLRAVIDGHSVKNYYLSLGTSSLYLGNNNGEPWGVQIVDPKSSERLALCEIPLESVSVSTSGTYEKSYYVGGRKIHHVIDAATGESAKTDILSVAVVGENGAYCDGLSTALIAMGFDRAKEFIKKTSGYSFVFVLEDGRVFSDLAVKPINADYEFLNF